MAAELVAPLGIPFYLDWKFWSFAVSFTALVVSVLPHLKRFTKAKLVGDVYQHMAVTHKVGNPNAQLFVMLTNSGGKSLRIKNISLDVKHGDIAFAMSGVSYFRQSGDKDPLLLTPFRLSQGAEWGHLVAFHPVLSQQDQRVFKTFQGEIRKNIVKKREGLPADSPLVEADADVLAPALAYFDKKFKWEPGEYEMTLRIATEPANVFLPKRLRMTIFESDSLELRQGRNDLKHGFDILAGSAPSVIIELVDQ